MELDDREAFLESLLHEHLKGVVSSAVIRSITQNIVDRLLDWELENFEKILSEWASAMGTLGGLKGGPARAKALSKKRRSQISKIAANARWKRAKSQSKAGPKG